MIAGKARMRILYCPDVPCDTLPAWIDPGFVDTEFVTEGASSAFCHSPGNQLNTTEVEHRDADQFRDRRPIQRERKLWQSPVCDISKQRGRSVLDHNLYEPMSFRLSQDRLFGSIGAGSMRNRADPRGFKLPLGSRQIQQGGSRDVLRCAGCVAALGGDLHHRP